MALRAIFPGKLTMDFYVDRTSCTVQLTFTSDAGKITTFGCNEGKDDSREWQLINIPPAPAPVDSQAFSRLFEGRQFVSYLGHIEILPQSRFSITYSGSSSTLFGNYMYSNTGPNEGRLMLDYDQGSLIGDFQLTFDSPTAGTFDLTWNNGATANQQNWHMVSVEKMGGDVYPDCLFLQVDAIAVFKTTVGSKHSCLSLYFDDPAEEGDYTASSNNRGVVSTQLTDNKVILIPRSQGTATVTVTATDQGNSTIVSQQISVMVSDAPDPGTFDIDLFFISAFTTDQRERFKKAARRWESIFTGDLADTQTLKFSGEARDFIFLGIVDDLLITIDLKEIDGPSGTWGLGAPRDIRMQSNLPITGDVWFDTADINDMSGINFLDTAVHEMGHVLGIGTLWDDFNFLQNPSLDANEEPIDPAPDTHFTGPLAIAAFEYAGGANHRGKKVPVENGKEWGAGSRDAHWRESIFGNEIMSTRGGPGSEPVSAITIQSLADIGYAVDVSQADPYRLPTPGSVSRRVSDGQGHRQDDVIRGPINVLDTDGNVVDIIE